jgi:hypothetical protein
MWDNKTKGIAQLYRRYSGMADPAYRDLLHRITGARSSTAAHLCGAHFEALMPALEAAAHLAEVNGMAVGKRPKKILDWYYWRKRYRAPGMATYAQLHLIAEQWALLRAYLPESERCDQYLFGIAKHATGTPFEAIHQLHSSDASLLIDALKDRLRYAIRRAG